jgi:hypothetical protein
VRSGPSIGFYLKRIFFAGSHELREAGQPVGYVRIAQVSTALSQSSNRYSARAQQ